MKEILYLEFCLNNVSEDVERKLKVDLFVPIKKEPININVNK